MLKEKENLVPALLADVFHTLHLRDEKRNGIIVYCLPLLYIWLTSNVFKADAWINEMTSEVWAQTLISLTGGSVTWYTRRLNVEEIIFNCGSFHNVPLI